MRLSKTAYYADFGVYTFIITGSLIWGVTQMNASKEFTATIAAIIGIATWTLVEYLMHRFIFHGKSLIAPLHARHHAEPRAYIGTPTWLSATMIIGGIFTPAWLVLSLPGAAGLSTGFMLAFLWYGIAHHLIHHRAKHLPPWLQAAAKRHFRHHHGSLGHGNFGLTTAFWDFVFGTYLRLPADGLVRMARTGGTKACRCENGHVCQFHASRATAGASTAPSERSVVAPGQGSP